MIHFGWLTTAALAYAAYRVGCRIKEENFGRRSKVLPAPSKKIGVDVSPRI